MYYFIDELVYETNLFTVLYFWVGYVLLYVT